jgi:hypothetical protein
LCDSSRVDESVKRIEAEKHIVSVREKCGQRRAWMKIATAVESIRYLGEEDSGEIVE